MTVTRCLLAWSLAALAACAGNGAGNEPRLYATQERAPSVPAERIVALDWLGPRLVDKGVNFGVYSERATRIELLVFEDPESRLPTRRFPMTRFGNVWNVYVEGVGVGTFYGYVAWGPNWPYDPAFMPGTTTGFVSDVDDEGNRFNPNKLLIDPYAKAVHRDHDWSKGSVASGPARAESTWAAAAKSVVVQSNYAWSENEAQWLAARRAPEWKDHGFNDLVVYEVHLKGFTADPASGVTHPGTYRGFGEKAAYLKELGVNAVELLPVHEKPLDGGYWGYMNLSFFAPEVSYAFQRDPRDVLDEFKWMVDQLHQHGVEVIVDVVYNHHGEGGLWRDKRELSGGTLDPVLGGNLGNIDSEEVAGLYSFRGLDNAAYYALGRGGRTYWNNTGVGQQSRPNHAPMRRLILDSLRFYVEELHVDGFRFDLAPILGEKDLVYNDWDDPANTVLQDVIDDPVLKANKTRIIAEPWSAGGNYGVKIGAFPSSRDTPGHGWYEWNARFRDTWRAFVNEDQWRLDSKEADADVGFAMTGFDRYYTWNQRRPYHTVNFVTVHDGFTMYDLVSYKDKQNGCSKLNPACCDERFSAWCDPTSGENHNRSRNWGDEAAKRQMMRNFYVAMLVSHGTPMLYGGDEWMRTQLGNNNAYSTRADNDANWFQWGVWQAKDDRHRMHDFVRQVVKLRHEHRYAFAPAQYGQGAPFAWKSERNDDGVNWSGRKLMQHYYDKSRGAELAILINMDRSSVEFQLPAGRNWQRLVDTQAWFDGDEYLASKPGLDKRKSHNASVDAPVPVSGASYGVSGSSIVILEAK
jgi:glycogen operon protein